MSCDSRAGWTDPPIDPRGRGVRYGHARAPADLVLTATNPLLDLDTLRKPLGVMAAGRWFDASELQAMRDQVARDYDSACGHEAVR